MKAKQKDKSKSKSKPTKQAAATKAPRRKREQLRRSTDWWQQMSKGKMYFQKAGGDSPVDYCSDQSASDYQESCNHFHLALQSEIDVIEKAKWRFRFWRIYLSLRYLQKSTSQAQLSTYGSEFNKASSPIDLIFRGYQFALKRCSPQHRQMLVMSAFDYVSELCDYITGFYNPPQNLLEFQSELVAFAESFDEEDLGPLEISKKIDVMDQLAMRYGELLDTQDDGKFWSNEQKRQIKKELGITASDYQSLSKRILSVIAVNKRKLDSPIIYIVYNRLVQDMFFRGSLQSAFELCVDCQKLISEDPIPELPSEHRLEFLRLFAVIARLLKNSEMEVALNEEFLEELLLFHPNILHSEKFACQCRRSLTDSYMCVELYCEALAKCLDLVDPKNHLFDSAIDRFYSLLRINTDEGKNESKHAELSSKLLRLIYKKLQWQTDPELQKPWLQKAHELIQDLNELDRQELLVEADFCIIEALSCFKTGEFTRMTELFENAIAKSMQCCNIDFSKLAKIHLVYSYCVHKVADMEAIEKLSCAVKQLLNGLAYTTVLKDAELLKLAETAASQFAAAYPESKFRRNVDEKLEAARASLLS